VQLTFHLYDFPKTLRDEMPAAFANDPIVCCCIVVPVVAEWAARKTFREQ